MLDGWLAAGLPPAALTVINPSPRALPPGVAYAATLEAAGPAPALCVLAVKPQRLGEIAPALGRHVAGALVVSVLAGVRLQTLSLALGGARIVRAVPNTPASIGRAVTLLIADAPAATDAAAAEALMAAIGTTHWVAETDADSATALSGSGPAFVFAFVEALATAGVAGGLDPVLAARLARETVAGAAALLDASGRAPADLRRAVTSPNGMTQAGLMVLGNADALPTLLRDTLHAAARRAAELGEEAAR